ELGRDVDVRADADDGDARVDEVGLAFGLAGAEVRNKGVALLEVHRSAREVEALVNVPAKRSADEEGVIENGVEAAGGAVGGRAVTGGVEAGKLEANPIAIVAELERCHAGADIYLTAGEPVVFVFAENVVERVGDIEAADVAIAVPAEVERLHIVAAKGA